VAFRNEESRRRLRVTASDGRDRSGWISAWHDKEWPLCIWKTPQALQNISREVFDFTITIGKPLPRYQGPLSAGRRNQLPCAISNLQQSGEPGRGGAVICTLRDTSLFARGQTDRASERTERVVGTNYFSGFREFLTCLNQSIFSLAKSKYHSGSILFELFAPRKRLT
jgi:hypothetical protein